MTTERESITLLRQAFCRIQAAATLIENDTKLNAETRARARRILESQEHAWNLCMELLRPLTQADVNAAIAAARNHNSHLGAIEP